MGDLNGIELFYWVAFLFGFGYAAFGLLSHGFGGGDADVGHGGFDHDVAVGHGGGLGHDVDGGSAGGHEAGGGMHVSPFNSLTIAAFSVSLGALGLLGLRVGSLGAWQSLAFALVGGFVLAGGFFMAVVRPLYRSQTSSVPDIDEVLRAPARVRTPIPAGGTGEIVFVAGGRRSSLPARTEDGSEIAGGIQVAILHIRKGVAYVVPLGLEEEGIWPAIGDQ